MQIAEYQFLPHEDVPQQPSLQGQLSVKYEKGKKVN